MTGGRNWQDHEIKELFKGLSSPDWGARGKALAQLVEFDSPSMVLHIFVLLEKENDDGLRNSFFSLIFKLLEKGMAESCGIALYILIILADKKNKKISNKADQTIKDFFLDSDQFRFVKVLALRKAWSLLPLGRRFRATKLAGVYRIFEATPFILENFKSNDKELLILTISVLRRLGDARGNKFIKSLLDHEDEEVTNEAVQALGTLGNFFDFLSITKFLKSDCIKHQISAIWSLTRLMNKLSIYYLKKHYKRTTSQIIKLEIIKRVGKLRSGKGAHFLMEEFLKNEDNEILLHIEWAFHEIPKNILLPIMIKGFYSTDELGMHKILNFFGSIYHNLCLELLVEVINGNYGQFLKMTAFDAVSAYDDQNAIREIRKYTKDDKDPLCYYAWASLFGHETLISKEIIGDFISLNIEKDSILHNVALTYIREKAQGIEKDSKTLNYISTLLFNAGANNSYTAALCTPRYHNNQIFERMCRKLEDGGDSYVKEVLVKGIIKIFSQEPEYLEIYPHILNHPDIVKAFHDEKMKKSLVQKICELATEHGIGYFDLFLSKNGPYLAENLDRYLKNLDSMESLEVILQILIAYEFRLSKSSMDFLVHKQYEKASSEIKYYIMMVLAKWPYSKYTDFMVKETMVVKYGNFSCKGLMKEFITNLS